MKFNEWKTRGSALLQVLITIAVVAVLAALLLPQQARAQVPQTITVTNASGGVSTYTLAGATPIATTTNGFVVTAELIGKSLVSASNYDGEVYGTYAPKAAAGSQKWGGGVLAIYNVSQHVGTGICVDYLGQFSLVSGNVTFKTTFSPLAGWGITWLQLTPNVFVGLGTPLGGAGKANGTVSTLYGVGDTQQFGHLFGGRFNVGFEAVDMSNAGAYNGWDGRLLFGWSKGF